MSFEVERYGYETSIYGFREWLLEHSYKVGYTHLFYLYSDEPREAKRFLTTLMYLDSTYDMGWYDDYVEYCSAQCFIPRARTFCEIVSDGAGSCDKPLSDVLNDSWLEGCWNHDLGYIKLALFDVQQITEDAQALRMLYTVAKPLAKRKAFIVVAGNAHPSKAFKGFPEIARFFMDGFVVKIDNGNACFEGQVPAKTYKLPFYDLVSFDLGEEKTPREIYDFEREELNFRWELLCTWKARYRLFDPDLFKDAFIGAWKCLFADYKHHQLRDDLFLLASMGGFTGGVHCWNFNLLTDIGPTAEELVYGDPCELRAAEICTSILLKKDVDHDLEDLDKGMKIIYRLRENVSGFFKPSCFEERATLARFADVYESLTEALRSSCIIPARCE